MENYVKRKKNALHFVENMIPNQKNKMVLHVFDRVFNGGKGKHFTLLLCGKLRPERRETGCKKFR